MPLRSLRRLLPQTYTPLYFPLEIRLAGQPARRLFSLLRRRCRSGVLWPSQAVSSSLCSAASRMIVCSELARWAGKASGPVDYHLDRDPQRMASY